PVLAMAFNWVRATLGTIPFVTVGARFWGVKGGLLGFALGAAVFGVMAVGTACFVTWRLAKGLGGRGRAARGGARRSGAEPENAALVLWKRAGDMGEGRAEACAGGADARYDRERDAGAEQRIFDRRHPLAAEHEPAHQAGHDGCPSSSSASGLKVPNIG